MLITRNRLRIATIVIFAVIFAVNLQLLELPLHVFDLLLELLHLACVAQTAQKSLLPAPMAQLHLQLALSICFFVVLLVLNVFRLLRRRDHLLRSLRQIRDTKRLQDSMVCHHWVGRFGLLDCGLATAVDWMECVCALVCVRFADGGKVVGLVSDSLVLRLRVDLVLLLCIEALHVCLSHVS